MKLVYLANPYTSYLGSRSEAFQRVCRMAAQIMMDEPTTCVFSPIAHSHSIEVESDLGVQSGDWWLDRMFPILDRCDELWVYKMPGWELSYGVGKEIECARKRNIPVKFIEYNEQAGVN
jgi:hypothetical protein